MPQATQVPVTTTRKIVVLLLLPTFVLLAVMLSQKSIVPSVMGRWSPTLFVFLLGETFLLAMALLGSWKGMPALGGAAAVALLGSSYFIGSNNMAQTRAIVGLVVISRFAIVLGLLMLAFTAFQQGRRGLANGMVSLGLVLLAFLIVDFGLLLKAPPHLAGGHAEMTFRPATDISKIPENAIAVVGDSMVFGQGVRWQDAFPNQLEKRLRACRDDAPVYNLGVVGAGFSEYGDVLLHLPRVRQVILCTYPNDIPDRQSAGNKMRQTLISLGNTSGLMRLAADFIGVKMYPDAHAYVRSVIADWDPSDSSFAVRWKEDLRLFETSARLSVVRSHEKPVFVLFPIVMTFKDYPLRSVHQQWQTLGDREGLRVVDMLPVFAENYPNGEDYLASANDNHFNATVHAKVAEVLSEIVHPGCVGSEKRPTP
jgi:hypothetical protein